MANIAQLETALKNADQAGDTQAATTLAQALRRAYQWAGDQQRAHESQAHGIPPLVPYNQQDLPPEVLGQQPKPEPSLGQKIVGAGEAGLSAVTGATTGVLGQLGGTLGAIAGAIKSGDFGTPEAAQKIHEAAMAGGQELTYQPKTEAGQQDVQTLGQAAEALTPVMGLTGEAQALGAAAQAAAPATKAAVSEGADAIAQAARKVVQPVSQTAKATSQVVKAAGEKLMGEKVPTAPPPGSAGAQAVEQGTLRQAKANELPVPIQLTKGQATRDYAQQRFEREAAKQPEEGAPIRERFAQQNAQLGQNLDAFINQTGGQLGEGDLRGLGEQVVNVLKKRAQASKNKVRALYKQAEKNGETQQPVDLQPVIDVLNQSRSAESTAPVLGAARKEIQRLGGAVEDPTTGELVSTQNGMTLNDTEQLRKFINASANNQGPDLNYAPQLKNAIDQATEGKGGKLYQQARAARAKYAKDYENAGLVARLMGTKRGTEDRAIALEDVLRKVTLDPSTSVDQLRHVKRLLLTKTGGKAGPGAQAWKEIQAGTLQYIKDQMTRNMQLDQAGNRIVSPAGLDRAIKQLDRGGKLDYIFGKQGADKLRLINEVAQDVMTSPPGTVNYSNTASVLAGMMDIAMSGVSGVPLPVMTGFRFITKHLRDAKLRAQVKDALGESK